MKNIKFLGLITLILTLILPSQSFAQRELKELLGYTQSVANYCVDSQWTTNRCLDVMAPIGTVVASNYMTVLKQRGFNNESEVVKDACAVASKVNHTKIPAQAVSEAYVLCINGMVEASEKTGMEPNKDYYNLLLIAYFCTSGNSVCSRLEKDLEKYKG